MADEIFDRSEVRRQIEGLAEKERADAQEPTLEEILRFQAREMSEEEAEDMRERLSLYPEAARWALDAADFPQSEREEESSWEAPPPLEQPRQAFEEALVERGLVPPTYPAEGISTWVWPSWAKAAAVSLLSLGLGYWMASFTREVAPPPVPAAPSANVQILALYPAESLRTSEEGLRTLMFSDWSTEILLELRAEKAAPEDRLRGEVRREGELLWRHASLVVDHEGMVTLLWPRSRLEAGTYEIRLFETSRSAEALHRYRLRVVLPDGEK